MKVVSKKMINNDLTILQNFNVLYLEDDENLLKHTKSILEDFVKYLHCKNFKCLQIIFVSTSIEHHQVWLIDADVFIMQSKVINIIFIPEVMQRLNLFVMKQEQMHKQMHGHLLSLHYSY